MGETTMGRKKDNLIWKRHFANLFKTIFFKYELDYDDFSSEYTWSSSAIRYWKTSKRLPQIEALSDLRKFLCTHIVSNEATDKLVIGEISDVFTKEEMLHEYYRIRNAYPRINEFVGAILNFYYNAAKDKPNLDEITETKTDKERNTRVVVFDFDGTLTDGKTNRTTWESIWTSLGYDVKECQDLHMKFNRKEISHEEWCKITEEKFRERRLHRDILENEIASKIHLIKGVRKTFNALDKKNIRIYIVSGSIYSVIKKTMGSLVQYIYDVKANDFLWDEGGFLTQIIGTKYDFEGKAEFIFEISQRLNISPNDILFVGNSINDQFAYNSGVYTLCINPKLTDASNSKIWNDCIMTCDDLTDILNYL